MSPAQEAIVVELRKSLLLPLDDLVAVTKEFICSKASRSGLDRATRWVFVQIMPSKSAANARKFLKALHEAYPIKIKHILTDNGKEFTDRLFASRARVPTGEHAFDKLCTEPGIEHRLTKPRTPQTNGMVERFNGRISDVLQSHHFVSGEDLAQTLYRYVLLYNQQLPQSTLGSKTPLDAMQRWYASHPHLFVKRPCNLAGGDTYRYFRSNILGHAENMLQTTEQFWGFDFYPDTRVGGAIRFLKSGRHLSPTANNNGLFIRAGQGAINGRNQASPPRKTTPTSPGNTSSRHRHRVRRR